MQTPKSVVCCCTYAINMIESKLIKKNCSKDKSYTQTYDSHKLHSLETRHVDVTTIGVLYDSPQYAFAGLRYDYCLS